MLRVDRHDRHLVLTVDEPERRNPLTTATMTALLDAVRAAERDDACAALVITGAGDRAFCAGGDLGGGFVDSPLGDHAGRAAFADLFRALRGCGKPTVARVNGHALAGGFGLAAACDVVIAVETARFGTPEIKVGLWPMMISAVLSRQMPHKAAFDLMVAGRLIDATEAQRLGVVSRVVPDLAALDAAVAETVTALTNLPAGVVALGRQAFYTAEDLPLDAALDLLHVGLTAVAMTDDAAEGVAAFVEKREPRWTNR